MGDDNKGFTVKDRRLFTPEGELRGQDQDAARPETTPSAGPAPPGEPQPPQVPGAEVDLASFLMSLAAQAGALLEGESAHDLEGARQIISILEMLGNKTQGRRTPEEDRILERLLYELRMAYVERTREPRA